MRDQGEGLPGAHGIEGKLHDGPIQLAEAYQPQPKPAPAAPAASTSTAATSSPAPAAAPVAAPAAPSPAPAPSTPAAAPQPPNAPLLTPAQPAPAAAPAQERAFGDSNSFLTGEALQSTINNMMEMGFEREQVMRALRASFNNPDRAVEYLFSVRFDLDAVSMLC